MHAIYSRSNAVAKMSALRVGGLLLLTLAAGCAGPAKDAARIGTSDAWPLKIDPSLGGTKGDSVISAAPPAAAVAPAVVPAPPAAGPASPASGSSDVSTVKTIAAGPLPPTPPPINPGTATAATPMVAVPAKPAVAPAATGEAARKIEPRTPVAKNPDPPLDMAALKSRLRDTDGIGVFTKLSLKNQVDDLMKLFRARYLGGKDANVASLRQPYDMLVLKVLAIVQDSDPPLARAISGSREAIWGILADPEKFNSII